MAPGRARSEREQQILDVATRAFAAEGYDGASMDRIAEAVGFTKPRLYAYFDSKETLFAACALRAWSGMGEAIRDAATRPGPPDVQLWRGIVAYFAFIEEHREIWRVMHLEFAGRAVETLRLARRGAVELMAELFGRTVADEPLDPALKAAMTVPIAQAFVGAATAIADWWLDHPEEPKELQALRLMNFAWTGLGHLLDGELWQPPPDEAGTP